MRSVLSTIQILVVLGALSGVVWAAHDYTQTKAENKALRAGQKATNAVLFTMGQQIKLNQERSQRYRQIREELRHVEEGEQCDSPVIDRGYDVLWDAIAD